MKHACVVQFHHGLDIPLAVNNQLSEEEFELVAEILLIGCDLEIPLEKATVDLHNTHRARKGPNPGS